MADQDQDLFSSDLISEAVVQALTERHTARPLRLSDYDIGFLDCLRELTTVGEISKEAFAEQFEWMQKTRMNYVVVIEGLVKVKTGEVDENGEFVTIDVIHVVATGTLVVERKFVHSLGLVGHIEDIAVHEQHRGQKLGLRIIQALDFIGEKVGCYKTILDCSVDNEGFYVKCGFKRAGLEMAHYFEGEQSKTQQAKV